MADSVGSRAAALCLRLRNAVHRQLCRLAEKRRYAGRHFSAVSLFVAADLSQRCSVVSLQSVLHGGLRSSSRCDFPIPKAVQPGCPNGFRTQFRFLRKGYLRHIRLDADARGSRRAGYGFRPIPAYRHRVGDARRKVSLHSGENAHEWQPRRLRCQRLDENPLVLHESHPAKRRPRRVADYL